MVNFPLPWLITVIEGSYKCRFWLQRYNTYLNYGVSYSTVWFTQNYGYHVLIDDTFRKHAIMYGEVVLRSRIIYIFRSHSTGEHTGSIPFNSVLRCVK